MKLFRGERPGLLDERAAIRRNRRSGCVGVLLIVIALALSAAVYIHPPGQSSHAALLAASGGARAGDEVRIAGVPVGKVTGVRLDRTVVRMDFDVSQSVVLGSDSTLEVKLLTPLGGHYVALDPKGAAALGDKPIPVAQTTTPFDLNDILQEATPVIQHVDGQVIHDTFDQIAKAVDQYPEALRNVLRTAGDLTSSLSQVTADYQRTVDFINEYAKTFVAGRRQLVGVTDQLNLLNRFYTSRTVDIVEYFSLLRRATRVVDRVATLYKIELGPAIDGADDVFDYVFAHPDQIWQALDGLGQILRIVMPMLGGNGIFLDNDDHSLPGPGVCVPNIRKQC